MNKLELLSQVLYTELKKEALPEQEGKEAIGAALKGFAADLLNQYSFFKDKSVPPEVIKELVSQAGINLDLRTNKFS